MRWYVLLALVVIVTLLVIQESEGWGRRRGGGRRWVVRRPRVRTRRFRRAVGVRTRRFRRRLRVRTRRFRRRLRVRTRRFRRRLRVRTRRFRRRLRVRTRRFRRRLRVRTRRFRRRLRLRTRRFRRRLRVRTRRFRRRLRVRTRRFRRRLRLRTRRIRFRTRRLNRILKKFKIKKLKRKVKKLFKKAKKLSIKKPKLWSKIKDWIKGKIIPDKASLQKWLSKLKGLISKGKEPPEPEEGTSGPGVQPPTDGPEVPPPTEDPFLVVQQGAFTFEAEGNDDSSSPYFSRKLHVFSKTSGVTVGRGYDVKDKGISQIKSDLTVAGIQNSIAVKLMNAIHLEGDRAKLWIKNNKLEGFIITTKQQKKLFELEYPKQLNKAKRMVEKYSKTGLKFDQMKQVVKDMIVDIFYRGDYSMNDPVKMEASQTMQKVFDQSKTSLKPMTEMMLDKDFWINEVGVDKGRYEIRESYMAGACEKDKNCVDS